MTKNHVGNHKEEEAKSAIASIRKYGVTFYPELEDQFKDIYAWIKHKRAATVADHVFEMKKLLTLFTCGNLKRYLSPNGMAFAETIVAIIPL
jgi:hypothetical protein